MPMCHDVHSYLLKACSQAKSGVKLTDMIAYLNTYEHVCVWSVLLMSILMHVFVWFGMVCRFKAGSVSRANNSASVFLDAQIQLDAFAHRAATFIHHAHDKVAEAVCHSALYMLELSLILIGRQIKSGLSESRARDSVGSYLVNVRSVMRFTNGLVLYLNNLHCCPTGCTSALHVCDSVHFYRGIEGSDGMGDHT